MPGPGALLECPQAAVEGRSQGALLPNSFEKPFENAEILEAIAERKGLDAFQDKQPAPKDLPDRAFRGSVSPKISRRLVHDTLEPLPSVGRPADSGELRPGVARAGKPAWPEICDDTARPERSVDLCQGMDHALRRHSSERP